jgi:hypothetical protein
VIHINKFLGVLISFCFFLVERVILIDSSPLFFWNIEHSPIEAPRWTLGTKLKKTCYPMANLFQFVYDRVELWANHMG